VPEEGNGMFGASSRELLDEAPVESGLASLYLDGTAERRATLSLVCKVSTSVM
jgi:hypothetical protein